MTCTAHCLTICATKHSTRITGSITTTEYLANKSGRTILVEPLEGRSSFQNCTTERTRHFILYPTKGCVLGCQPLFRLMCRPRLCEHLRLRLCCRFLTPSRCQTVPTSVISVSRAWIRQTQLMPFLARRCSEQAFQTRPAWIPLVCVLTKLSGRRSDCLADLRT